MLRIARRREAIFVVNFPVCSSISPQSKLRVLGGDHAKILIDKILYPILESGFPAKHYASQYIVPSGAEDLRRVFPSQKASKLRFRTSNSSTDYPAEGNDPI